MQSLKFAIKICMQYKPCISVFSIVCVHMHEHTNNGLHLYMSGLWIPNRIKQESPIQVNAVVHFTVA